MEKLSIDMEALLPLKQNFDKLLVRTVRSMVEKSSYNAVVSVKLNIDLIKTTVIDSNAPDGTREIIKPDFTHKVSSVMQVKAEEQSKVDGNFELTWDDLTKEFVLRNMDDQISLYD